MEGLLCIIIPIPGQTLSLTNREQSYDDDDDDDDDDASAHVRFRFDILLTRMLDDSLPAAGFDWCRTETALRWHRNGIQFLNGCD